MDLTLPEHLPGLLAEMDASRASACAAGRFVRVSGGLGHIPHEPSGYIHRRYRISENTGRNSENTGRNSENTGRNSENTGENQILRVAQRLFRFGER